MIAVTEHASLLWSRVPSVNLSQFAVQNNYIMMDGGPDSAVTSLDGDNGDWGRKMPKIRKILEEKKEDLDLCTGRIWDAWRGCNPMWGRDLEEEIL